MSKRVTIYTLTHKKFNDCKLRGSIYKPLFVGAASSEDTFDYLRDDTGDNISYKNCYYSELTGLYWIYKNVTDVDIVGTCHYRRYLTDGDQNVLSEEKIISILSKYDIITSKCLKLNNSYYYGFGVNHKPYYLDNLREVIALKFPDYLNDYDRMVNDKRTYFGNIMICQKELFCEYAKWLFLILFTLEERIVIEEKDSYHQRIFGFISEFLLYLWVRHNGYKACECKVGIIEEKIEIYPIKRKLSEYFEAGEVYKAKEYFLQQRKLRPDIMMEASDITGELHMCMEAIAIASLEKENGLSDIISRIRDYDKIIRYCRDLNDNVRADINYSSKEHSEVALYVARQIACD